MKNSIVLAAGCFWGVEEAFSRQKGVTETSVGYIGGKTDDPTYREVCDGNTGHAEAVEVHFDENETNIETLLRYFFEIHDPTSLNRQGNDVGSQYRSAIFYLDQFQQEASQKVINEISKNYSKPIVTEVVEKTKYWPAEEYHQKYLKKNPNGYCHIKFD